MTDATRPLTELQDLFLASSTQSMPVAGMTFWAVVGIVALFLEPGLVAYVVLFGSGMIFPLAILIDRATGKRKIQRASAANPLLQLGCRGPERAAARRRPGARLLCRLPAGTGGPYQATAISAVVLVAYGYSLLRMRRPVA